MLGRHEINIVKEILCSPDLKMSEEADIVMKAL